MNWLDRNMETLLQQAPAATVRFVSHSSRSNHHQEDSNPVDTSSIAAAVVPQQPPRQFMNATSKPINDVTNTAVPSSSKPIHVAEKKKPVVKAPPAVKHTHYEIQAADKKRRFEFKQIETRFCDYFKISR
jgi:hypothetical protein